MQIRASRSQLVLIFSSGISLGFVLFVYQAFGIYQGVSFSGHSLLERVVIFTASVCIVFAINELIIKPKLTITDRFRNGLWIFWEVFSAGSLTHLLFNYFWNWTESNWGSYFLLMVEFSSVMIIPFGIYFLLRPKESKRSVFVFTSDNGKEKHAVQSDSLLYVKAEDNYVRVYYKSNAHEKSFLIRRKLSDIEKSFPSLVRVHRSFLINNENVIKMEQKSRSARIHFEIGGEVPVSDKYQSVVEHLLNRHA